MIIHAGSAAFPITLDRSSPVPLYHQLFEQFTAAIARGDLRPGHVLEREDLLAARLEVARPTLRRALHDLAAEGVLNRTRGHGTVVIDPSVSLRPKPEEPGPHIRPGRAGDRAAGSRVLKLDPDHQDAEAADDLGLAKSDRLIYLERLVFLNGRPVSLRREWMPASMVNPALHDLATKPCRLVLSEAGHPVVTESRSFTTRLADSAEKDALNLSSSMQVFMVSSVAFDPDGVAVERTDVTSLREAEQYEGLQAAS